MLRGHTGRKRESVEIEHTGRKRESENVAQETEVKQKRIDKKGKTEGIDEKKKLNINDEQKRKFKKQFFSEQGIYKQVLDFMGTDIKTFEEIEKKVFFGKKFAVEPILERLMEEGEIFQPTRGRYRALK